MEYKFCYLCGSKLTKKSENLAVCPKCGQEIYLAARVCNGAFIENERGEILLIERAIEPSKGLWDIPGGFIDPDETAEASTLREIDEELGVKLENIRYFGSYPGHYQFMRENYHTLCLIFTGDVDSTKLKPADDVASYCFFPKDKLPFDKLGFPILKVALEDYLRNRSSLPAQQSPNSVNPK